MKRILSFFVLTVFCFTNLSVLNVSAAEVNSAKDYKQLIISKSSLNKTRKGKKYVESINSFIVKTKDNKKQLEKLSTKLGKVLESKSIRNKETLNVIKYLNAKVNIALFKISIEEKNAIFKENISESDKKVIEDRIVKLQLNTIDKSENLIKVLTDKFENYTNVEESGDFEVNYNMNYDQFGEFKGNLKLSDYTSTTSGFDTQFKGKVEALFKAIPKGEDEIKLEVNSMLDLISKDGNIYLLLKDFNILDEKGVDNLKDFLDKAKEIAAKNKYIKYSDPQTQMGLEMLKSFNPQKLISDGRAKLSKPLITAYKKEGNRYLLKPTKYACDTAKELANKFDPFNPGSCSDSQYKDLLKSLNKAGSFYAEISGNETKIGFVGNKNLGFDKNEGYITFNDNKILGVLYNLKKTGEGEMSLDYKVNSKLNFSFNSEKEDFNINLISKLNKNNKFENIDFDLNIKDYGRKYSSNLKLLNNRINGDIKIYEPDYNETKGNVYGSFIEAFSANITGKTYSNNSLSELNVDYVGTDINTNKKVLDGKGAYSNKKFSFENNFENESTKSNILLLAQLDNNNMIDSGNFNLSVATKKGSYNYDTYKYEYTGDFQKIVNVGININNKNITGTTVFFDDYDGKELVKITHSGNYSKDKFKLDNKIELSEKVSEMFSSLGGYAQDAKNSKVYSDLSNIVSSIEIGITKGDFDLSEIMLSNNKINFKLLGANEENFKNPDGSNYLIFVKDNMYQVYGTIIDKDGNIIAKTNGNYYKKDNSYSDSLVLIDGKRVKNGDIVGKTEVEKEEVKKITGNFNIDTDLTNNKNNVELFINALLGEDEIFNLNIKNIGTRIYKKIEIKEPTNTIDYKEAFGIQDSYNDSYYY